jgi:acid phosphatase family membrane protein YuiD
MNVIREFFGNYTVVCALIAYFSAQILKILIALIRERRFDIGKLIASGGMPSSHSSTVVATMVAIAKTEGIGSSLFALSFVIAAIVMYDAAGVRRAAGEQAKLINRMVDELLEGNTEFAQKNLKELIGHTPLQVAAGAALGFVVPFLYVQ